MLKHKLLVIFLAGSYWFTATVDVHANPLKLLDELIAWVDDLYRAPEIIPKLTREVVHDYDMRLKIDDLVSHG